MLHNTDQLSTFPDCDVDNDHYWVIGFARGTMNMFVDNILKIPELATSHATQQLIADIGELEQFCL